MARQELVLCSFKILNLKRGYLLPLIDLIYLSAPPTTVVQLIQVYNIADLILVSACQLSLEHLLHALDVFKQLQDIQCLVQSALTLIVQDRKFVSLWIYATFKAH